MEKVMIEHPFHEHSLILRESVVDEEGLDCCVCRYPIHDGERVYRCVEGERCSSSSSSEIIFHQRCGELPTQISVSSIHSHPLYLADPHGLCFEVCNHCHLIFFGELGYRCSRCPFYLHLTCKEEFESGPRSELTQPNHDYHVHPLRLLKIPPALFSCDGCGIDDHDMLYACTTCGFVVHKNCASLPLFNLTTHHPHQLRLSTQLHEFRHSLYWCHICYRGFNSVSWVYYCPDCRFYAHIKCVAVVLKLPLEECDVYKELIRPFVILERNKILGVTDLTTPRTKETQALIFNIDHVHALSFVEEEKDDDDGDDDDDDDTDDDDDAVKMKKICDACATLISLPPYFQCAPCNYFLHEDCYWPLKTLSSLQSELYGNCPKTKTTHNFTASKEKKQSMCDICDSPTKGMVYGCKECGMKMDMKCASLPTSIEHASHPGHKLVKRRVGREEKGKHRCYACGNPLLRKIAYCCSGDECDFAMCPKCVVLPKSVMKRKWDEHPLLLTYDASIDHPPELYCEFCEEETKSKKWMYRCGPCDNSFHLKCVSKA